MVISRCIRSQKVSVYFVTILMQRNTFLAKLQDNNMYETNITIQGTLMYKKQLNAVFLNQMWNILEEMYQTPSGL